MSGYSDSRRSSDLDRNRGRDYDRAHGYERERDRYRERSPTRDSSLESRRQDIDYRSGRYGRRGSYDDFRGRGRQGSYRGIRGRGDYGGVTNRASTSSESLPELPTDIPIPESGSLVKLKVREVEGTAGRPITVAVNQFVIQSLPIVKIYQYEVKMAVPVTSQRRGSDKVSAMQQAKTVLKAQQIWGNEFVFDGVALGWSRTLLMPIGKTLTAFVNLDGHTPDKPNQVQVSLRNAGTLNVRKFVKHLKESERSTTMSNDPEIENLFKALNAIYRQDPASRFLTRPKDSAYFNRSPSLSLTLQSSGGVLEALRGAFQAVSYCFGQLSLTVDVANAVFWIPGITFIDLAKALAGIPPHQQLHEVGRSPHFRQGCERLLGMFCVVKHLNSVRNAKRMKIQQLSLAGARETTFEELDRSTGTAAVTSVQEYFQKNYDIHLQYPDLPLLVTSMGMFPMELCYTPQGERYKEALQGAATADFIAWATSNAYVRAEQIIDNVKRFAWHSLAIPSSMGLSVSTSMLQVRGRVLTPPTVVYKQGQDSFGAASGSWNLRGKTFLKPSSIHEWGLLYLPGGRGQAQEHELKHFCQNLATSLRNVGLSVPNELPAFLMGNANGDIKQMISDLRNKTAITFGGKEKPRILFFLLHENASSSIYKAIKGICEVDLGIPSQVLLVEKALMERGQMQYLGNVAMKVNCKLGGTNSKVEEPLFQKTRFMMLGADTSHPSPGELRRMPPPPSYCALPATVELIAAFSFMIKALLTRYKTRNGNLPESVIYWRDGLSDSQISAFLDTEVKDLRSAFEAEGVSVKLTIINCVKNHHMRMWPKSENGDRLGNVMPGTVIETAKNSWICASHSCLQGTLRPTHYTVLEDNNDLSIDDLQRLAMNGAFSYGRATRSVSIHPAVYYADQAAVRASFHLRETTNGTVLQDVHPSLHYTMYWQ